MTSSPAGDPYPDAEAVGGRVTADGDAPTESLVSGTVGDRCVNCSAPLSSDQRYCVVCGERRGAPRFALPVTPAAESAGATPPSGGSRAGAGRFSTGTTLIAGVATLLLALLVGVLIGHNSTTQKSVAAAPVKIVTVGGGSATPAASTPASGSAATGSAGSSKKAKHGSSTTPKPKKQTAAVKKQAAKKEASAASKVLGGKGTPPPTVTVGAKGSGKGYSKKTHKFNGSFFGN